MMMRKDREIKRNFVLQCHIPEKKNLKNFVSRPPTNGLRLYCTMIRYGVCRQIISQQLVKIKLKKYLTYLYSQNNLISASICLFSFLNPPHYLVCVFL